MSKSKPSRTPEARAAWHLEQKYGIVAGVIEQMLKEQNYSCPLCLLPFTFENPHVVDHNHETCKVRGLLHDQCNLRLGQFEKNRDFFRRAAIYTGEK